MFRPGFRESAFQPFKKEDGADEESDRNEKNITEEEDSEGDEMVDIEKIEDKEEDIGSSSPLVRWFFSYLTSLQHTMKKSNRRLQNK